MRLNHALGDVRRMLVARGYAPAVADRVTSFGWQFETFEACEDLDPADRADAEGMLPQSALWNNAAWDLPVRLAEHLDGPSGQGVRA
jgi:hypothetical protein